MKFILAKSTKGKWGPCIIWSENKPSTQPDLPVLSLCTELKTSARLILYDILQCSDILSLISFIMSFVLLLCKDSYI